MSERLALREKFLAANGLAGADCPLLAGDASFRKYYRLIKDNTPVVLMDAPPPVEDVRPFIKIGEFLSAQGFSAPLILAKDEENGFLLLEDLGDDTFSRLLDQGSDETALYQLATDALIDLHTQVCVLPPNLPAYDADLLHREADLFVQWWMAAQLGAEAASESTRQSYRAAWAPLFERIQDQPATLVLRDFHVDNLLVLPDRTGTKACGLLDFQDAVAGSGVYDLMSLLEDARRDIKPSLIHDMKRHYTSRIEGLDDETIDLLFALLGAQRHAKVIGIFTRLAVRDGKPIYLKHIPRVWRLFERALEHEALKDVKDWVDAHVDEDKRGIPSCLMD